MTKWSDILGQSAAVSWLKSAIESERLPHGLIFSGPMGVGKAMTAKALGAWFLCEKPSAAGACGKCQSCHLIEAGTHPDYHVITKEMARLHDRSGTSKATALAINVIRHELSEVAARKTVMGRGKVFIIEEAHLMTPGAQNALLKTLEEPAGRTLLVLLAEQYEDLLPTIRSRCQMVRFVPLDADLVKKELQRRGIDEKTADAASELTDGSLGLAMRWIDEGMLETANRVASEVDSAMTGRSAANLIATIRKSAEATTEAALKRDELMSKDAAMRNSLGALFSIAARRLRQRLTETTDADELDRTCQAIESINMAEKYLDANVNIPLVLEQLGIAMSAKPTAAAV